MRQYDAVEHFSDMKKGHNDTVGRKDPRLLVGGHIFAALCSILLQVCIARIFLSEGRGEYALFLLYATVIQALTLRGSEYGIRLALIKRTITAAEAAFYLVVCGALSLAGGVMLCFLIDLMFSTSRVVDSWESLVSAMAFVTCQMISVQMTVLLSLEGHYTSSAKASVLLEMIKVPLVLILSFSGANITGLFAVLTLGTIPSFLFAVKQVGFERRKTDFIQTMRSIQRYGWHAFIPKLSMVFNANALTYVISRFVTLSELGVFSLAFSLVQKSQVLPDALNRHVVAELKDQDLNQARMYVLQWVKKLALFFLCVFLVLLLCVDYVIAPIFGSEFANAGEIIVILAVGLFARNVAKPIEAYYVEYRGELKGMNILTGIYVSLFGVFFLLGSAELAELAALGSGLMCFYAIGLTLYFWYDYS